MKLTLLPMESVSAGNGDWLLSGVERSTFTCTCVPVCLYLITYIAEKFMSNIVTNTPKRHYIKHQVR